MIRYPKKVLFATDGTEDSRRAATLAAALCASTGAGLHVVHVGHVAPTATGGTAMRPPLPGEPPGYAERQARRLLDGQVEEIRAGGAGVTGAHLRMGDPASQIIAVADELGADLLVVGSGGPRRVRRAVATTTRRPAMGKVSETLVHSAPCPVLVVRGEISREARA